MRGLDLNDDTLRRVYRENALRILQARDERLSGR